MKLILLLILAAAAAGFLLPPRQEGAADNCAALEVRVRRLVEAEIAKLPPTSNPKAQAALQAAKEQAPNGAAIARLIQDRLPMLPPEAGCAVAYWATVWQPDLRQLAPALLPPRG